MARSIDELVKTMLGGSYVQAKYFRRAIDRNEDIRQRLNLHSSYKKRFDNFAKAARKAKSERGGASFFEFEGKRFQANAALRTVGAVNNKSQQDVGRANFAQTRGTLARLFPDLVAGNDLGHKNISVARVSLAAVLNSIPEGDQKTALKALYAVVLEIDSLQDKDSENINTILDKVDKAAKSGLNVKTTYQKDVKVGSGKQGSIELELEPKDINRYKGYLAGIVSQVYKDVIEGNFNTFEKFIGDRADLLNIKGSPSMRDDLENAFVDFIDPKKKRKSRKSSTTKKVKTKGPSGVKTKKPRGAKHRAPREAVSRNSIASQPLQLIGIINQQLPQVVAQNMGEPALVNRTGRFASSVRAVDIVQTPQGFPSVGYTYMKNPYQTFEQGYAQGSTTADPRKLIDKSIREIAIQFAIGRFYTRRV
jgi:hypothetical protein